MSHLDNQKRQFTSRFYSNDITSFSNNDPRPVPSDLSASSDDTKPWWGERGMEGPWSKQSWAEFHKKGLIFWCPALIPNSGSVYQSVCVPCLVSEYSWLTIFPDIIYLQKTDDADVMSWVASSVTACHNIWPRKCIMHMEELKLMSFLRFVLHCTALCGDIYTALYFAGTGDSECTMAMHPGLRGDANLGMFNYAIV